MVQIKLTVSQNDINRVSSLLVNQLPGTIRDEITLAIKDSLEKVRDTINTDYKRFGILYPSYLNPSRSGLGFTDRTGRLRSSITSWIEESSHDTTGILSAGTDYDKYVELLWGGKYAYMFPAFMQNQDYIVRQIQSAVERAIDRLKV